MKKKYITKMVDYKTRLELRVKFKHVFDYNNKPTKKQHFIFLILKKKFALIL